MEIDNRYWAGLFDGEGNIYFAKDLFHIKVSVTQKETAVLYLLRNRFGGQVYSYKKQLVGKWEVFNKADSIRFLEAMLPHLIIKAIEARLALEALKGWNLRGTKNGDGGRGRPMLASELDRRKSINEAFYVDRVNPKNSPIT